MASLSRIGRDAQPGCSSSANVGNAGGSGISTASITPPTVLSGMARRGEKPKLPSYGGKSPPQRGIDLPPGLSEAG
ncbi:hypothetical protein NJB1907f44_37100 [Mycobacterium marinum]|nr:hypothetical protein NJB1808e29_14280 [Mycobacterium marinum]GJN99154.1 hypothetical protein NJB1907f34b_11890 [Mycobacterium marinum]GJO05919.1 hypothetical protein NJB18091_46090 [Mycobacterium marinum]GJO13484.1 hypothetical protein NJB1907E90_37360 [Mycobacterium marinum]GJO19619.1 hypothetical protein NJB1728e18_18050 [Mycobacterium marinum]